MVKDKLNNTTIFIIHVNIIVQTHTHTHTIYTHTLTDLSTNTVDLKSDRTQPCDPHHTEHLTTTPINYETRLIINLVPQNNKRTNRLI